MNYYPAMQQPTSLLGMQPQQFGQRAQSSSYADYLSGRGSQSVPTQQPGMIRGGGVPTSEDFRNRLMQIQQQRMGSAPAAPALGQRATPQLMDTGPRPYPPSDGTAFGFADTGPRPHAGWSLPGMPGVRAVPPMVGGMRPKPRPRFPRTGGYLPKAIASRPISIPI